MSTLEQCVKIVKDNKGYVILHVNNTYLACIADVNKIEPLLLDGGTLSSAMKEIILNHDYSKSYITVQQITGYPVSLSVSPFNVSESKLNVSNDIGTQAVMNTDFKHDLSSDQKVGEIEIEDEKNELAVLWPDLCQEIKRLRISNKKLIKSKRFFIFYEPSLKKGIMIMGTSKAFSHNTKVPLELLPEYLDEYVNTYKMGSELVVLIRCKNCYACMKLSCK